MQLSVFIYRLSHFTSVDKHWVNELGEFTGLKVECTSVRGHYEQDSNFTILHNNHQCIIITVIKRCDYKQHVMPIRFIFTCQAYDYLSFWYKLSSFSRVRLHAHSVARLVCRYTSVSVCVEVAVVLKIISRSHNAEFT